MLQAGKTALMYAADKGQTAVVELLLLSGASANVQSKASATPPPRHCKHRSLLRAGAASKTLPMSAVHVHVRYRRVVGSLQCGQCTLPPPAGWLHGLDARCKDRPGGCSGAAAPGRRGRAGYREGAALLPIAWQLQAAELPWVCRWQHASCCGRHSRCLACEHPALRA